MYRQRFNPHKKSRFGPKPKRTSLGNAQLLQAIRSVEVIKKEKDEQDVFMPSPSAQSPFSSFDLSRRLLENISAKGYKEPTPIQEQTIPAILAGRDVIGIANTGTGKTAAFLIPLIQQLLRTPLYRVLIIAPTRELAFQIQDELKAFTHSLPLFSTLLIGGTSMKAQQGDLRRNPHFVIGTPGRIKDLIEQRSLYLGNFSHVVLDEADRMVDIGFIKDIKYFISLLPQQRQSLFFSATISSKEEEIISAFVHNPVTVSVKQQETSANIAQDVVTVEPGYKKIDKLHDLLSQEGFDKVLIFGRTKWGIEKLTKELIKRGFRAGAIHGNKNQNQRLRTLEQFKNNGINILLATDVASRGLDISDVTHVINYDMPASMEDYVHRIGRTGRANKKGVALTFVE